MDSRRTRLREQPQQAEHERNVLLEHECNKLIFTIDADKAQQAVVEDQDAIYKPITVQYLTANKILLRAIDGELARLRSLPTGIVYKHVLIRELDASERSTYVADTTVPDEDGEILIRTIITR